MKKNLYLLFLIGIHQIVKGQNSDNGIKANPNAPSSVNPGVGTLAAGDLKLTVAHQGSDGALIKSSGSFSVVDIDAFSGDAALRFYKVGVGQWNIRNRPSDDNLEVFELSGGGSRLVIQNSTGNVGIGFDNPTDKLAVGGNVRVNGFSQLGSTSPRIKMLKFTGTTDLDSQTSIVHGLNAAKIISMNSTILNGTFYYGPGATYSVNFQYNLVWNATEIQLDTVGSSLQGDTYVVTVIYEE